jgi:hypothetical protein
MQWRPTIAARERAVQRPRQATLSRHFRFGEITAPFIRRSRQPASHSGGRQEAGPWRAIIDDCHDCHAEEDLDCGDTERGCASIPSEPRGIAFAKPPPACRLCAACRDVSQPGTGWKVRGWRRGRKCAAQRRLLSPDRQGLLSGPFECNSRLQCDWPPPPSGCRIRRFAAESGA